MAKKTTTHTTSSTTKSGPATSGAAKLGNLPTVDADKVAAALRDAAYVAVGFSVLAVQRANVQRRELAAKVNQSLGPRSEQIVSNVEARLSSLDDAFEARLDETVTRLEHRLPNQAGALVSQVHGFGKSARQQVRAMVRSAA